jgi:hydroxymethylglutaryl-CoA lyase
MLSIWPDRYREGEMAVDDDTIVIREVLLRDGLQNLKDFIPTELKIELFGMIVAGGITHIEFTSFVNPKAVPQFADADQVAHAVIPMAPRTVQVAALVPNLKGAQRALENGVRRLEFVMSVSESHNLNNVRRTTAESIQELGKILELREQYPTMEVGAGMATVFGCPFEGKIPPATVLGHARQFYALGIRSMAIADTIGTGNPKEVKEVSRLCMTEFPDVTFSIHLHNTRGLGAANAFAAYESGIRIFDGAIGGLGGCPFAPGARGNVATEDLVYLFEGMGLLTGIRMDALLGIARYLQSKNPAIRLSSNILEAGLPKVLGAIAKNGQAQAWSA